MTLAGCILCVTIIGIPLGTQCFKFASLAFFPFWQGDRIPRRRRVLLANLLWLLFFGWEMAVGWGAGTGVVHHDRRHSRWYPVL